MANLYVRSTDGSDADNGTTWALAKATLDGAAAIDASGDVIYVSQVHTQTQASALTLAFAGSSASPQKIICGNDGAEPPTAVATSAAVANTGNNAMTLTGLNGYIEGIGFTCGGAFTFGSGSQYYFHLNKCDVILTNNGSAGQLILTETSAKCGVKFQDCRFKFGATSNIFRASHACVISGGSVISGSSAIAIFITFGAAGGRGGYVFIENFDFSNLGSTLQLVDTSGTNGNGGGRAVIRNCKLPAAWTGTPGGSTGPSAYGQEVEMSMCDPGDVNYRFWSQNHAGECKSETAIIRTGGASDGTTPFAWRMNGFANAEYPHLTFNTPERAIWNETLSSMTLTVEAIYNTATAPTDGDVWVEVIYLGTSGFCLGTKITDAKANVLATAATQTASTATGWDSANIAARANTTAYTAGTSVIKLASNPDRLFFCTTSGTSAGSEPGGYASAVDGGSVTDNTAVFRAGWRQKYAVTFTPAEKGPILWRVVQALASITGYIDAKATLS